MQSIGPSSEGLGIGARTRESSADRFEIEPEGECAPGGAVHRARDGRTGETVAMRFVTPPAGAEIARLARELAAIAELSDPAIERGIGCGTTRDGRGFLATEWIDAASLVHRLEHSLLSIDETIALARRLARGLAYAHACGIVHRGLCPRRVLVPAARVDHAKIVGFRPAAAEEPDEVPWTPGFLSPEQARGERQIDPRTDVFALGCTLFASLVGRSPFEADTLVAMLARVVFEDAPRVRALRPEVPRALDEIVARLLCRTPSGRPADGTAVLRELEALRPARKSDPPPAPASAPALSFTLDEQRLVSVIVAKVAADDAPAMERARAAAAPFGTRFERLADGTSVAALWSNGSARDQATRAARCALALRDALGGLVIAVSTGRAAAAPGGVVGDVIGRAASALDAVPAPAAAKRAPPLVLDEITARLLDGAFETSVEGGIVHLHGEQSSDTVETRALLGVRTPFVGRERELATLQAAWGECVGDSAARAVLVTAPSGFGKSRLRHELVRRVADGDDTVEVWTAKGDPMTAGSPFGMLAQVVRVIAGVGPVDNVRVRQSKLQARVAQHVPAADAARVTEFLGELAGIRFPESKSVQLQAARRAALLMGDQMRRAWEDFLAAECAAHPVLLVLEDMHWGDLPTVSFLDAALRRLRGERLMVLALARPEVHAVFPQIWSDASTTELRLAELPRAACERLVRDMVGETVAEEIVERVVEQAAGNAFYLEELIRHVMDGRADELPGTVIAMVQARLERLEPEARRVLRAASIFGGTFFKSGITSLLENTESPPAVGHWLSRLVDLELVARRGRGADEHVFRHAIVRDVAYATLTEQDRVRGHRHAAIWLEQSRSADPMTLAEQFERGREPTRAARWYGRAAAQALEGDDLPAVLSRARKGIACGATGEDLAAMRMLEAEAHRWRGEVSEAEAGALEAWRAAPPGSALRFRAAAELVGAAARTGCYEHMDEVVASLCEPGPPSVAQLMACATSVFPLLASGHGELGSRVFARLDGFDPEQHATDPSVSARIFVARATRGLFSGHQEEYLTNSERAALAYEAAGDLRRASAQRMNAGHARTTLGAYASAETTLRAALLQAERLGLTAVATMVRHNLGMALALRGGLHEGRAVETAAIEAATAQGDRFVVCAARIYLAEILLLARNVHAAERELTEVLAGDTERGLRAQALATLARVHLAMRRPEEALSAATEAFDLLTAFGGCLGEMESSIRHAHAEAAHVAGRSELARSATLSAVQRLLERARAIRDPDLCRSFLDDVPPNARTLALARELGIAVDRP